MMMKKDLYTGLSVEWFSALLLMIWGLFLLCPIDSFTSAPGYHIISKVASEQRWGTFAIICSIFHIVVLTVDKCAYGYEGRVIAIWVDTLWWCLLTILAFFGNNHGHGWVVYGSLTLALVYSLVRLIASGRVQDVADYKR